MKQGLVIIDFDGTIAHTEYAWMHAANKLAPDYGYKPLTEKQVKQLRSKSLRQIMKEMNITFPLLCTVLKRARKEVEQELVEAPIVKGMEKVLKKLQERNISVVILTSNAAENVTTFLHKNTKLKEIPVEGYSSMLGKAPRISALVRKYGTTKTTTVYIGDEPRDIEAGKKAGVYTIAVEWGFSARKLLVQSKPHFIVKNTKELEKALNSIKY